MAHISVDVRGETCPIPLIEFRKAIRTAAAGDTIEIQGTHPASQKEIPMAAEALGAQLLGVDGSPNDWTIRIRR
ncbi:MAG: sulfurtransferase TusA family protein [Anaerolineae bacterium]|jgi:tRNA 2-thiouridine synthesizing protein A|nr:sulfurtransferase TusA family protein [Chloroflexota bacterium]